MGPTCAPTAIVGKDFYSHLRIMKHDQICALFWTTAGSIGPEAGSADVPRFSDAPLLSQAEKYEVSPTQALPILVFQCHMHGDPCNDGIRSTGL